MFGFNNPGRGQYNRDSNRLERIAAALERIADIMEGEETEKYV